jgi:hypothetical protein
MAQAGNRTENRRDRFFPVKHFYQQQKRSSPVAKATVTSDTVGRRFDSCRGLAERLFRVEQW